MEISNRIGPGPLFSFLADDGRTYAFAMAQFLHLALENPPASTGEIPPPERARFAFSSGAADVEGRGLRVIEQRFREGSLIGLRPMPELGFADLDELPMIYSIRVTLHDS